MAASLSPRNKQAILLGLVLMLGFAGLWALQWTRAAATVADERTVVQAPAVPAVTGHAAAAAAADTIQRIPGNLLRVDEQPEAGRPFSFEMANFSQGAVYELDLGDGARKSFEQGKLRHTYQRPGAHTVTLYARYGGESIRLQTITKVVARAAVKEKVSNTVDF
jgi:hypothetical protein